MCHTCTTSDACPPLRCSQTHLQLSDWADGAAARALGQNSALGSYLDPLADKVGFSRVPVVVGWQGHSAGGGYLEPENKVVAGCQGLRIMLGQSKHKKCWPGKGAAPLSSHPTSPCKAECTNHPHLHHALSCRCSWGAWWVRWAGRAWCPAGWRAW